MTDRELLELAAKAAGYRVAFGAGMPAAFDDGTYYIHDRGYPAADREGGHWWNPLLDDGDALRLAADLDLFGDPSYWHWLAIARLENSVGKHANVRSAIVRAAAEIGKNREKAQ